MYPGLAHQVLALQETSGCFQQSRFAHRRSLLYWCLLACCRISNCCFPCFLASSQSENYNPNTEITPGRLLFTFSFFLGSLSVPPIPPHILKITPSAPLVNNKIKARHQNLAVARRKSLRSFASLLYPLSFILGSPVSGLRSPFSLLLPCCFLLYPLSLALPPTFSFPLTSIHVAKNHLKHTFRTVVKAVEIERGGLQVKGWILLLTGICAIASLHRETTRSICKSSCRILSAKARFSHVIERSPLVRSAHEKEGSMYPDPARLCQIRDRSIPHRLQPEKTVALIGL